MDYRYIEQLLERYWQCQTTIEEERILHAFFSQDDIPASLLKYKPLFDSINGMKEEEALSDDFDKRMLAMIEEPKHVKARIVPLSQRLMPLFRAAAVVAIILTLGNAAQTAFNKDGNDEEIDYANYKDTYKDPNIAYDKMEDAIQLVSEGIGQYQENSDSIRAEKAVDDTVKIK